MSNEILNSLLKDYEQKKLKAEINFDSNKEKLYKVIPRLKEIENEINRSALINIQNTLKDNNSNIYDLNAKINNLKKEKISLLKSVNISEANLKPKYECNICNDTGYITTSSYKSVMCNCLKQKLLDISFDNSNLTNLVNENFLKFNPNVFPNDVDFAKYSQNISPRTNILNIQSKCIEFINNFDNPNYKNLLFTGHTGLGKSFMSNCIAYELLKKGKTVLYQTAPVLLESVIDYKMSKDKNPKDNIYKAVLEADLLIIDDLGTESLNSMKLSELFNILNARILNLSRKPTKTIISTNLSIKDIFKNYEERIGSRIAGYYDIYYFFGTDLRFNKNR